MFQFGGGIKFLTFFLCKREKKPTFLEKIHKEWYDGATLNKRTAPFLSGFLCRQGADF